MDDVFKNRNMTFEDIQNLNIKQFNNPKDKKDGFLPSDILDLDDNDSDDEILKKFRNKSPQRRNYSPHNQKLR